MWNFLYLGCHAWGLKMVVSKGISQRQTLSDVQESVILYWLCKPTVVGFLSFDVVHRPATLVNNLSIF